jgi:hypothetical protein
MLTVSISGLPLTREKYCSNASGIPIGRSDFGKLILSPVSLIVFMCDMLPFLVWIVEVSEPAPGSVIAIPPDMGVSPSVKRWRNFSFCSLVPVTSIA